MRALLQRVKAASVVVDGACVGQIKCGLLALVGGLPASVAFSVTLAGLTRSPTVVEGILSPWCAGICEGDTAADAEWVSNKILAARLWPEGDDTATDGGSKPWKVSVVSYRNKEGLPGQVLVVSQFTLYGHLKANKPDFHRAMKPGPAGEMFDGVVERLRSEMVKRGGEEATSPPATGDASASASASTADAGEDGSPDRRVATGAFGAMMDVSLVNDGPVTLMLDSRNRNNGDPPAA
jgi:D-tyrosyl-tRNA(Tyr) deacylase